MFRAAPRQHLRGRRLASAAGPPSWARWPTTSWARSSRTTSDAWRAFPTTPPPSDGAATARCLIIVTPDGQRTMATFLGAASLLGPDDVDPGPRPASARPISRAICSTRRSDDAPSPGRGHCARRRPQVALTLSDAFVVDRHRAEFLDFISAEVDVLSPTRRRSRRSIETADFDARCAQLAHGRAIAARDAQRTGRGLHRRGEPLQVPAEPIERVVDATGAGDLYAAGV